MVEALPAEGGSVAMTAARGRVTSDEQGALAETRGALDRAIEGEGYFTVLTPEGEPLTRAGAFARSPDGEIVVASSSPGTSRGATRSPTTGSRARGFPTAAAGRSRGRWGQQGVDRALRFRGGAHEADRPDPARAARPRGRGWQPAPEVPACAEGAHAPCEAAETGPLDPPAEGHEEEGHGAAVIAPVFADDRVRAIGAPPIRSEAPGRQATYPPGDRMTAPARNGLSSGARFRR
jgi:hypothetical protein